MSTRAGTTVTIGLPSPDARSTIALLGLSVSWHLAADSGALLLGVVRQN